MTASTFRTRLPSHLIRRAAFDRLAQEGEDYGRWLDRQWMQFSRRYGYRVRNGDSQAHFDRHLESMK